MARPRRSLAERFAKKVNPKPTERGCLLWMAFVDPNGRGRVNSGGAYGKPLLASRVAWELVRGPIPDGQCVCHRCDNPLCVNVEHLFLGTQRENIDDMLAKKRSSRGRRAERRAGEAHGMSKLTWEQVCEIRERHAKGGVLHRELGAEFGVTRSTISLIVSKKHWTTPGQKS